MKVVRLLIFFVLFRALDAAYAACPFFTFEPPLIQAGTVELYKTDASATPLPYWSNTYIRTLSRLKNLANSDYWVALGIKSFFFKFNQDSASCYRQYCSATILSPTTFNIFAYVDHEYYFVSWKINYLAGSYKIPNIYFQFVQLTLNQLVTPTPIVQPVVYSYLTPSYSARVSISTLWISYNTLATTTIKLLVEVVNTANPTTFDVKISGADVWVKAVGMYIMFVDSNYFNDYTKQTIIYRDKVTLATPGPNTVAVGTITTETKRSDGYFVMLNRFDSTSHESEFQVSLIAATGQLSLTYAASISDIRLIILITYGNECPGQTRYSETQRVCKECLPYCAACDVSSVCQTCMTGFTLSTNKDACTCPYPVVTDICYDFANSPMKGCVNAVQDSSLNVNCVMCKATEFRIVTNNQCLCKPGFRLNAVTQLCEQICGDGLVLSSQCDDGNTIDNDGCTASCTLQSGFMCNLAVQPTNCWSLIKVNFRILSIFKNDNNTATIKLAPQGTTLPVPLQLQQFTSNSWPITLTKSLSPPQYTTIYPTILSIQNNQISLLIDYQFTIQDLNSQLSIDMSKTKYPTYSSQINFIMKGTNHPLVYSSYMEIYQNNAILMIVSSAILVLAMLAGALANKYIGVQAIVTMQLIFYTQLLIIPSSRWPVGFVMFDALKYSNGYNDIVKITKYELATEIQLKFHHLNLHKTLIQNFNISFILLFVVFVIFIITSAIRQTKEKQLIKVQGEEVEPSVLKQKHLSLKQYLKINEFAFHSINQLALWCLLQLFAGMAAQIKISNKHVELVTSEEVAEFFHHINEPVIFISSGIIFVIGLNYFGNTVLSSLTVGKMRQRPMQINYKRAFFVYLCVMGFLVLFTNQQKVGSIPVSVLALLIHILYIILLIYIKPYQLSLTIHTIGLFTCNIIYLIFLFFINIINFVDDIPDMMTLIFGFVTLGAIVVIIGLTIARLYYEYRYGEELEIQIQKEREMNEKRRLEEEEAEMRRKMKQIQLDALKKPLKEDQKLKNTYLIESQIMVDNKNDLLMWLETRTTWTKEQKEEYFFKHFDTKPANWLKTHDQDQYKKTIQKQQIKIKLQKQRIVLKKQDPQYSYVVKKLQQSYHKKYNRNNQSSSDEQIQNH